MVSYFKTFFMTFYEQNISHINTTSTSKIIQVQRSKK